MTNIKIIYRNFALTTNFWLMLFDWYLTEETYNMKFYIMKNKKASKGRGLNKRARSRGEKVGG